MSDLELATQLFEAKKKIEILQQSVRLLALFGATGKPELFKKFDQIFLSMHEIPVEQAKRELDDFIRNCGLGADFDDLVSRLLSRRSGS